MTANAWMQLILYLAVLIALVKPVGWYMARVYQGQACGLDGALGWLERLIYRLADKGLVYRPERGVVAFAVPLFGEYLRRRGHREAI